MGFQFRKGINLGGGLRINLSKSGIGYSWGVKGYRVTKTSTGRTRETMSLPGTGIRHIEEHSDTKQSVDTASSSVPCAEGFSDYQNVTSADVDSFTSPAYDDLFAEIRSIVNMRVWTCILLIISFFFWQLFLISAPMLYVLWKREQACSVSYDFDEDEKIRWDNFSKAWKDVASSQCLYEIVVTATSENERNTAGISKGVGTGKISVVYELPNYLRTNIIPIVFQLQNQQLAIMPDRLFLFNKKWKPLKLGALDYEEVAFDFSSVGFVEPNGEPPSDSELVKMVWQYANKDGSPDKRHKDNKQYPVMNYGKIIITSPSGLNIQLLCSNEAAAERLKSVING